jgi:DNA (cytosine-5)-methyltransferase 1
MAAKGKMRKPKILDLFCGAGGCAVGYSRAGFDVVGVDLHPQPHYPFEFHQDDAMEFPISGFDAVHASPPCQKYSRLAYLHPEIDDPDLAGPIRDRLRKSRLPYVIENVPGAPLQNAVTLCGTMFDLRVLRHRKFEANFLIMLPGVCNHWGRMAPSKGCYHTLDNYDFITCAGHNYKRSDGALAMGIDWWVTREELSEAIPPAYTEYIGKQLRAHIVCAESAPENTSEARFTTTNKCMAFTTANAEYRTSPCIGRWLQFVNLFTEARRTKESPF